MCEHDWNQQDPCNRVCLRCNVTETDLSPMQYWISPAQASRLGFDYRDRTTGLLVLTRTGHIDELPV